MKHKTHPTAEKYKNILAHLGYANNTQELYSNHIDVFLKQTDTNPYKISKSELNEYLLSYKYSSKSNQNQVISAFKIYACEVLNIINMNFTGIKRPRKDNKLPNIIPEAHLKECLSKIDNLKHKAILNLTYSVGLRLGDIQNLRLSDLSSKANNIKVNNGKGAKDAYLPLYPNVKNILINYCIEYKIKDLLFEGQNEIYSATSLNNLVKKYIGKQYHFHNLRHSFATHLHDKGVDIAFIQKMLRHKDVRTTLIYLNISTKSLERLPQLI